MNSPKQKRDRPIESVELKLTFNVSREAFDLIREKFPSVVLGQGACEVVIRREAPAVVANTAKEMLDFVREAVGQSRRPQGR
jgi:hypothetical protein